VVVIDGLSPSHWQADRDEYPFATLAELESQGVATLEAQVGGGPGHCGDGALFDSSAGLANILTGVDCRLHRVSQNEMRGVFARSSRETPTLLAVARNALGLVTGASADVSMLAWNEAWRDEPLIPALLNLEGVTAWDQPWSNLDYHRDTGKFDAAAVDQTLEAIIDWDVDVMLTHFDEVDHIGHMRGWSSPGWTKRLDKTDRRVGEILAGIRGTLPDPARAAARRAAFAQEDWLVVLVSDHGGHDAPMCHDGSCCVPGFGRCGSHDTLVGVDDRVPLMLYTMGGRRTELRALTQPVTHMDVAPTVLAWLGAEALFELAGRPGAGHVQGLTPTARIASAAPAGRIGEGGADTRSR
jgi:hypothetical protein